MVKPDVGAPGVPQLLGERRSSASSSSYFTLSGAIADILQKSLSLTPDQVKARLMNTAWKSLPLYSSYTDPVSGITYNVFTVGAGYVDREAALVNTDLAKVTAMSPIATFNSSTDGRMRRCGELRNSWWGAERSQPVKRRRPRFRATTACGGGNALWGGSFPGGEN
jgi:hypothetical protein